MGFWFCGFSLCSTDRWRVYISSGITGCQGGGDWAKRKEEHLDTNGWLVKPGWFILMTDYDDQRGIRGIDY